jgi:type I restriction enzyme S subunit
MKEKFSEIRTGSTIPHLNCRDVRELQIPLPPYSVQKRIVATLDTAIAAIATATTNAEKNLQNARELFESTLQSVFAGKGEGWVDRRIDEITNVINGYAFKSGDFSEKNGVKSVKITNVGVGKFVTESNNNLPLGFQSDYSKFKVGEGDIVIALTRSIISSGLKVAIVPSEYNGALLNQRVAALKVDQSVVEPGYLYAYLCSHFVVEYVRKQANTLMQPNLSITDLKCMPVSLPNVQEQKEIVEKLDALLNETRRLEAIYQQKLGELSTLKQSLLQKAFSGQLTAKPGSQPAPREDVA